MFLPIFTHFRFDAYYVITSNSFDYIVTSAPPLPRHLFLVSDFHAELPLIPVREADSFCVVLFVQKIFLLKFNIFSLAYSCFSGLNFMSFYSVSSFCARGSSFPFVKQGCCAERKKSLLFHDPLYRRRIRHSLHHPSRSLIIAVSRLFSPQAFSPTAPFACCPFFLHPSSILAPTSHTHAPSFSCSSSSSSSSFLHRMHSSSWSSQAFSVALLLESAVFLRHLTTKSTYLSDLT